MYTFRGRYLPMRPRLLNARALHGDAEVRDFFPPETKNDGGKSASLIGEEEAEVG